jgi:pheromone alpha factor receptor
MPPTSNIFDPLLQNITLIMADGVTPVTIQLANIDRFFHYNCKTSINYGSQLGACAVMFIVTALLTQESKRRKPVYILNLLSLVFGILRALLLALYAVSPWTELYTFYTMDLSRVSRLAYATSVAGAIIPLFMTITVNASLFLQAYTVSKVMDKKYVIGITALSGIVFLLALGFRFAQVVTNSKSIMDNSNYFDFAWIQTGTLATETISIWFYSIIFTGKLCWTIYTRKNLGFQQWSYIQILSAMGGCTMVIPGTQHSLFSPVKCKLTSGSHLLVP